MQILSSCLQMKWDTIKSNYKRYKIEYPGFDQNLANTVTSGFLWVLQEWKLSVFI